MPPIVVDPGRADDARDAVHHAVQVLAEGQLVVFPTETVYGVAASGLSESAVQRLLDAKHRPAGQVLSLAVGHADLLADYCPDMSPVARRLARRCLPGPLTLVLDGSHPHSLLRQLPDRVRQSVQLQQTTGFRVPDHPYILEALRLMEGPLVLSSANISGQGDAVTSEEVVEALGDRVALILSDGRSKYARPSTVVRVDGHRVRVLRSGVLSDAAVRRAANLMVLLVCTGNTCRSPMAQVLFQQRLAAALGCSAAELEQRGIFVLSAGLSAMEGAPASPEAVDVMQRRGLSLAQHESRPVSDMLVRFADLILALTEGHRAALIEQWPEATDKTYLLRQDEGDVTDPIGGTMQMYERCAEQIEGNLDYWLDRLDLQQLPEVTSPADKA